MATTQHSIRIVKRFLYRGDSNQEFSNRYYFNGGSPGDSDAWHTFMDGVVLVEKAIYATNVTIVAAFGYAPGSEVAVASKETYTTTGTWDNTGGKRSPGDCAAVLRMATTKLSSKNHTVYCFSYFHGCHALVAGPDDNLMAGQKTAIELYGNDWLNGITVAGRVYKRTTPDGHLVTGRAVDPYIGHRDFPR